jgi:EAL domain-containing protein (putative c-di-GMP-specific phosphodiesterase class I)/GGDEF domain-containing protein
LGTAAQKSEEESTVTLFRQIAILISLLFLLLLGALAWNDFRQSGRFLQGQLQTTAQDMATLLGVSVTGAIRAGDTAAIDTIFNAVFDSGYYSQLLLTSPKGALISSREQPVKINRTPSWFVDWVPLVPATGRSQVMEGWLPYGNLSVTLHPGYAYAQLYQKLKSMVFWFALMAGTGLAALWWMLHLLLRPLETVRAQAEAIQENRFFTQEPLPRTRELHQVAEAMNRMVTKVQTIFNDQADILDRHHATLYRDPQTGLGSRHYVTMKLTEACADEATSSSGWLVLLKLNGLTDIKQNVGYCQADTLLSALGGLLIEHIGQEGTERAGRLNSSEFALLLPADEAAAEDCVKRIFTGFRSHPALAGMQEHAWLCAGLAAFGPGCAMSAVLANADFALIQALSMGPWTLQRSSEMLPDLPHGKSQWRSWLEAALREKRLFLVGQEVHNADDGLYHRELFVRLRDTKGCEIPASAFMPVAASQGLEFAIDRAVFEMTLALRGEAAAEPIALNLSTACLVNADALAELERFLNNYKAGERPPLSMEISHFALLQHTDTAGHIADLLRAAGYRFGIDRLDLSASLAPLQHVRPHYIKIGSTQLSAMADNQLSAFQALRTLANSLDIRLIAVGVDSGETQARLTALAIDGMQGYFLGRPMELK